MTTEERLEILERELARAKKWNLWVLASLSLAVGLFALGWYFTGTTGRAAEEVVKEVRANKFTLVDAKGRSRAMLGLIEGGPGLALYDENGEVRVWLAVSKDGPGLSLADENGKTAGIIEPLLMAEQDGLTADFQCPLPNTDSNRYNRRGRSLG